MRAIRGFTLIETLISTAILMTGLVAVAAMFSYSIRTNVINRQRTTATILLYEKMEEFKAAPRTATIWSDGSDQVTIAEDGRYVRVWKIMDTMPRSVTIVIYSGERELMRASTLIAK